MLFRSRRAYLEFIISNNSDTLFHSGANDAEGLHHKEDNGFEHHYELITNENEVQIYEFVMGDDKGEVTTVLERAFEPLKDNRIPPIGFSQSHNNYDTVRVVGDAEYDADYTNGSGNEHIIYAIPGSILNGPVKIKAALHYETVPESWLEDLFEHSDEDDDINRFKTMYNQLKNKSFTVAQDSMQLNVTGIQTNQNKSFHIYPNPSSGKIHFTPTNETYNYSVYSSSGNCIKNGLIKADRKSVV